MLRLPLEEVHALASEGVVAVRGFETLEVSGFGHRYKYIIYIYIHMYIYIYIYIYI